MIAEPKISTGLTAILQDVLDRPVAFHRSFVKLTGSVTAALLLSQAMYWSKRINSNGDGWFYKTRGQWEEETGLSRYEQESARRTLRRFSFWKEELRGVPAQMHYKVDISILLDELIRIAESRSITEKNNKIARLLETSQLDGGKPTNKKAAKQQTCLQENSQHYKGISETTTETIKTTTPVILEPVPDSFGDPGSGRDFVKKLLVGTILQSADARRIANAAKKYARSYDEIEKAIDVLDQQYRQSGRRIDDPTALVVSALKDGIDSPDGYVPKAQREAEEKQMHDVVQKKIDEERRMKEVEDRAYKEAEAKLAALPEKEREDLFSKAKLKISPFLQNSQIAVKTQALELMIAEDKTSE